MASVNTLIDGVSVPAYDAAVPNTSQTGDGFWAKNGVSGLHSPGRSRNGHFPRAPHTIPLQSAPPIHESGVMRQSGTAGTVVRGVDGHLFGIGQTALA
jgi:hypothetical protein